MTPDQELENLTKAETYYRLAVEMLEKCKDAMDSLPENYEAEREIMDEVIEHVRSECPLLTESEL